MTAKSERIDALEAHVAFQDDTVRQLNDALVAQQGRLDRMQAELEQVVNAMKAWNETSPPPGDERPPHY
jgi:SlyX protein